MISETGSFCHSDFRITYSAVSDKGLVRSKNEDSFLVLPGKGVFSVADGVGGLNDGDVASKTAMDGVRDFFSGSRSFFSKILFLKKNASVIAIDELFASVNRKLFEQNVIKKRQMATTMTLVVLKQDLVKIAHVGDSRVYLFRNDLLEQITQDHSLIAELQRQGLISRENAKNHPRKNVITRAIGAEQTIKPSIKTINIRHDDILLLCTDGVTSMLDDQTIKNILSNKSKDVSEITKNIVNEANNNGGKDNITVIAILFKGKTEINKGA